MKSYALLPLSCALLVISGCTQLSQLFPKAPPVIKPAPILVPPEPVIPPEPAPTPPFYQVNPKQYGAPLNPEFEALVKKRKIEAATAVSVSPTMVSQERYSLEPLKIFIDLYDNKSPAPRFAASASADELDVTEIDQELAYLEGKARHYPPVFGSKRERYKAEIQAKALLHRLDKYALDPRASYDVLIRAVKINVMARNMDVGPDAAANSAKYFQRLLALKPADPETSFWYGFSLAEGGGFKESIPHLRNAIKGDIQEAYLSLANTYLQLEQKANTFKALENYQRHYPSDTENVMRYMAEIKANKRYSIWQNLPPREDKILALNGHNGSTSPSKNATQKSAQSKK